MFRENAAAPFGAADGIAVKAKTDQSAGPSPTAVRSDSGSATVPPAWPEVSAALADSTVAVEVLPVEPTAGEKTLAALPVEADSWLGALALHTGGVLVDHGWLRILGGGCPARGLTDVATASRRTGKDQAHPGDALFVGADVLGGRYLLRGQTGGLPDAPGELPGEAGEICYLGPDSLRWEPLEWSHADWVSLMVGGAVADFYHDLRWSGWEADVAGVKLGQLLSCYPPVYTREGRASIATAERKPVPAAELYGLIDELAAEL